MDQSWVYNVDELKQRLVYGIDQTIIDNATNVAVFVIVCGEGWTL